MLNGDVASVTYMTVTFSWLTRNEDNQNFMSLIIMIIFEGLN